MLRNIPPPVALKALLSKPGDPTRQERKLRKTTRSWRLPNLGMTYKIRNLFVSIFVSFVFSAQFIIKILVFASWFEYGWYLAETNIISDILDRSIMIYTDGMGPAPKGMLKVFDHDHLQFGTLPLPQPLLSIHVNPGPHLFVAPRDEKSPHPKSVRETPNEATQQVLTSTKLGELPTVVPPSGASASMRACSLPRKPQNAPVTNDSLASLHGTYALERSWKPKVWESCFPYEPIVILISLKQFPWKIGTW